MLPNSIMYKQAQFQILLIDLLVNILQKHMCYVVMSSDVTEVRRG